MDVGYPPIIVGKDLLKAGGKIGMPLGAREKRWLRPISEVGGGSESNNSGPSLSIEELKKPQEEVLEKNPEQSRDTLQVEKPQQQQQQQQQQPDMQGGNMDILSSIIGSLNGNPYFIGMLMLLLNLGGRFLSMELTPKQEEFLQQRWLRPFIFFTVIFIATRNLAVAFWMTLALFLILWILANEQSPFCLIPSWRATGYDPLQKEEQYEHNMDVLESIYKANAPTASGVA